MIYLDGLVGPTHHFGALSTGNRASLQSQARIANPKAAALQGLEKMKVVMDLGLTQALLPPHERPSLFHLRALGFSGSDEQVIASAYRQSPKLLSTYSSASSMWAANSATVTPSSDSGDKKLHLTPANLNAMTHRSIEAPFTYHLFQRLFPDPALFALYPPLPHGGTLGDEGSANHIRLGPQNHSGLHLFTYGQSFEKPNSLARGSLEATLATLHKHRLPQSHTVLAQQNSDLIQKGIFHNDLISMGCENTFLYHPQAFLNTPEVIDELQTKYEQITQTSLNCIEIPLSLEELLESYLMNSQLLPLPNQKTALIAPIQAQKVAPSLPFPPTFVDLSESMQNGGGPACLTLKIPMTEEEKRGVHPHIFLTDKLYLILTQWIEKHYRDRLSIKDLSDPQLLKEGREALNELTSILHLPQLYFFQN